MNEKIICRLLYVRHNNFIKKKNTIPLFINITLIFKIKKLISTIMSDKNSKNIKIYFLDSFDK
jgi:hypothetical protein